MTTSLPGTLSYPQQLEKIRTNMAALSQVQPEVMNGFANLHSAAATDGALDTVTKELIALAISVASRCDGCIAFHTHDALNAGATPQQIADALGVAVLMGGGPSVIYATHVMEAMEQFQQANQ